MRGSTKQFDFSYYNPVNENQKQFHKSTARHKLLIGTYRSGKTYPAIHEALMVCLDNPGHEFAVFRNTWDSLRDNIQKDMLRVSEFANCHKRWDRTHRDLYLWNDTVIRFRPLTLSRQQLKGLNLCGYLIDDPDVNKYWEVISFLATRLTNPPHVKAKYFESVICANYEGHDKLWATYMRRRPQGGNGRFAWWYCKTKDNPTLEEDYIEDQAAFHSKAWMDRYIYGNIDNYSGLVYEEYRPEIHDRDLTWCFADDELHKIMVIDCGITHPTVVLKMATDYENAYVYDEWWQVNIRTAQLGDYLVKEADSGENFRDILIDPKSCAREQVSGTSPRKVLADDFGLNRIKIANNNVKYGVEIQKGMMTCRDWITHWFVDPVRCPQTTRELETLKWKEPQFGSEFDELAYKEEPEDKDNDCTDCTRYGSVYLKKFLKSMVIAQRRIEERNERMWNERFNKLKMYRENPALIRERQLTLLAKQHYHNRMSRRKSLTLN